MFGHGDTVNELRTDPNNSELFASVSKDNSARIWHVHCRFALICLGGQKGHLDQVLSCVISFFKLWTYVFKDWSPDSSFLVTCSMDHSIRLWKLDRKARQILNSATAIGLSDEDDTVKSKPKPIKHGETIRLKKIATIKHSHRNYPYQMQFPTHECTDLHTDYVDCVRFIGNFLISKVCTIFLNKVCFRDQRRWLISSVLVILMKSLISVLITKQTVQPR